MCARLASTNVLAVDGGGTRCRLALDGPDGRHQVEVGAANVSSDFNAAIAEITRGLDALAEESGIARALLLDLPAHVGLAGVPDAEMAARVAAALPLARAHVEDDRRSALRGALGPRDGAIAHFGTGSFFALQAGPTVRLSGGWGWRLGDEGSAYWVGRSALTITLEAVDALIDATPLTDALLDHFGSPGRIVAHAGIARPGEIAALAPRITEAAASGDAVGRRILQAGADHIVHVLDRMGWQAGMALCLTGGLGIAYRDFLPAALADALVTPAGAPIEGALALARDLAEGSTP